MHSEREVPHYKYVLYYLLSSAYIFSILNNEIKSIYIIVNELNYNWNFKKIYKNKLVNTKLKYQIEYNMYIYFCFKLIFIYVYICICFYEKIMCSSNSEYMCCTSAVSSHWYSWMYYVQYIFIMYFIYILLTNINESYSKIIIKFSNFYMWIFYVFV